MEDEKAILSIHDVLSPDSPYFDELGKPVYMNDTYYKKVNYDFISKVSIGKKNGCKCIMPNCNKKPIKKSHTISEKAVLKKVSNEKGKLLYPKYISIDKKYILESIGTHIASTFSGFCIEHERMFEGFEKNGNLHDQSILLQNFRVVCRDLFFFQNHKKYLDKELERYCRELLNYHTDLLKKTKSSGNIISVEDEISKHIKGSIEFLNSEINLLKSDIFDAFVKDIQGCEDANILTMKINFPLKFPICFGGRSLFGIVENENKIFFNIVLSILPSDDETVICFTTNIKNKEYFASIFANYQDLLSLLSFLESWMIYGSDYWFINPGYWNDMKKEKQERILNDLLHTDCLPTLELEYSIFDDIRKELLEAIEYCEDVKENREVIELLVFKEREKLDFFDD